ncbi:MAG: hypothetical protein IJ357_03995 [Oscillospiraceae bacterium]|nr:hypothetical protein [Oscillospiraceae bacterium]
MQPDAIAQRPAPGAELPQTPRPQQPDGVEGPWDPARRRNLSSFMHCIFIIPHFLKIANKNTENFQKNPAIFHKNDTTSMEPEAQPPALARETGVSEGERRENFGNSGKIHKTILDKGAVTVLCFKCTKPDFSAI